MNSGYASLTRYVWIGRARNGLPCCVLFFVFFGQSFPEDIIKFSVGTKLATCTVPSLPLAKAMGWDNIPIRIIKDDIDFIAGPLSNLFYYILTVDISVIRPWINMIPVKWYDIISRSEMISYHFTGLNCPIKQILIVWLDQSGCTLYFSWRLASN